MTTYFYFCKFILGQKKTHTYPFIFLTLHFDINFLCLSKKRKFLQKWPQCCVANIHCFSPIWNIRKKFAAKATISSSIPLFFILPCNWRYHHIGTFHVKRFREWFLFFSVRCRVVASVGLEARNMVNGVGVADL